MKARTHILSILVSLLALAGQAQPVLDTVCVNGGPSHFAVPYQERSTYYWQVNGGQIVGRADSSDIEVVWGQAPGVYEIAVTAVSEFGCPGDTSRYKILLTRPAKAEAKGPAQACRGELVTLEAAIAGDGEFEWSGGERSSSLTFVAEKDTTISLISLNSHCANDTVEYTVEVYDAPVAAMNFIEDTIERGTSVHVYYTGTGRPRITWLLDDRPLSSNSAVQIDFDTRGEHEIVQCVEVGQCSDTIRKKVYVEDIFKVFIPNAFTPNNDGANDYFTFDGVGIKSYRAQIYNRWGQRLFEWTERSPVPGWDGTYNGQESKIDAYIYKIVVEDMSGKLHFYTAEFSLIR